MNRPIKFRYFDKVIKSFVYSDEFDFQDNIEKLFYFFGKAKNYADGEIQQFTGLIDKNGKEIYKGDILQFGTLKGVVKHEEYLGVESESHYGWFIEYNDKRQQEILMAGIIEIVGNIFQHSELIK